MLCFWNKKPSIMAPAKLNQRYFVKKNECKVCENNLKTEDNLARHDITILNNCHIYIFFFFKYAE